MLVSAFFDESGKFHDQSVISLAGVASCATDFSPFHDDWTRHLRLNGLKSLSMKSALNCQKPLSPKRKAIGIANRIDALLPFANCIRKHLQVITGIAVDVQAFRNSPSHLREVWSDDPIYMAFAAVVMEILGPLNEGDRISVIYDDEEKVGLTVFRLYRKIKISYPSARRQLASISFADDNVFTGLQAADFLASLIRLEAQKRFNGEVYEYGDLFSAIATEPREGEKIWGSPALFCDQKRIEEIAKATLAARKREQAKAKP